MAKAGVINKNNNFIIFAVQQVKSIPGAILAKARVSLTIYIKFESRQKSIEAIILLSDQATDVESIYSNLSHHNWPRDPVIGS